MNFIIQSLFNGHAALSVILCVFKRTCCGYPSCKCVRLHEFDACMRVCPCTMVTLATMATMVTMVTMVTILLLTWSL